MNKKRIDAIKFNRILLIMISFLMLAGMIAGVSAEGIDEYTKLMLHGDGDDTYSNVTIISDGDLEDEDCSDISDWVNWDHDGAVSEQVSFDGKSTFRFDTNEGAVSNAEADRRKNLGSVDGLGNRIVVSIKVYHDTIGLQANADPFHFHVGSSDWTLNVNFASDGLFIYDGAAMNEVGTDLVIQDVWQEWTFDADLSGGAAIAVCDVYLNGVLQAADVDCSQDGIFNDGDCMIKQKGDTTNDQISYLDWFKVGNGFEGEGHTFTANGDPQYTDTSKFSQSASFDGTGDYLSIPDSDDWDFGTGDFTIDFRVNFDALPGVGEYSTIIIQKVGGGDQWYMAVRNNAGTLYWRFAAETTAESVLVAVEKESTLSINTQYHMTAVRSGNNWMLFQNGIQVGTTDVDASAMPELTAYLTIGRHGDYEGYNFNGSIDELRISKGIARWTSDFTPPSSPHDSDSNTKLLLHMDGSEGSTSFTDSSSAPHAVTANGDAKITGMPDEFKGGMHFDGVDDYLSLPDSDDWDIIGSNSDNWTIDTWIKGPFGAYDIIASQHEATWENQWALMHYVGGGLAFLAYKDGVGIIPYTYGGEIIDNNWHHVALSKVGSKYGIYLDGSQVNYVDDDSTDTYSSPLYIGMKDGAYFFKTGMDEFRIQHSNYFDASPTENTDRICSLESGSPIVTLTTGTTEGLSVGNGMKTVGGLPYGGIITEITDSTHFVLSKNSAATTSDNIVTVWTDTITVPSSPYIPDSDTKLLLHLDGDESASMHPVTFHGDPSVDGTTTKFDGSFYFDGVGDYLSIPDSDNWDLTGEFTVDFWVKRNGDQSDWSGIMGAATAGPTGGWVIGFGKDENISKIHLYSNASGSWASDVRSNIIISDNTWTHVAVIRNENTIKMYFDGSEVATQDCTGYNYDSTGDGIAIGRDYTNADDFYLNGSLDEIRISKGVARWTSNFIPDTLPYTATNANGESCAANSDCTSNICAADLDGTGSICVATGECNYLDTQRADTYSTCYDNDDYTCNAGTWESTDCYNDCGYYVPVDTCSAAACVSCPTSCSVDGECDANAHCDNTCIADLAAGNVCDENSDCISDSCRDDYDAGMFCADSSTDCVHDGVSYDHGTMLYYRWTCNNGAWDEDTTPPNTLSIGNVEQNPTPTLGYYWDSVNNGNTTITLTADEEVSCRVGENDQNYSSMTGSYWECTFNALDDIECVIPGLSEDRHTYYVSCKDLAGNDQHVNDNTPVTFGIDYTKPTTSVLDTAGNHLPGHSVIIDESDNLGTIAEIITRECHPNSGCAPTTIIENGSTVAFSIRGTNYIRWYSIDAAGNEQNVMEDTVTINSLPSVSSISYALDGNDGTTGSQVFFYCDINDANGGIGSNYDVKIWVKRTGSGTWDKLDNEPMNYDSANRFKKQMSIGIDGYGVSYDVMCQATDDMEETGSQSTQDNVFSVVNSAPIVDDITIQAGVSKFDTMRIYCDGSDPDMMAESSLVATLYLKTDNAGTWDRLNGVSMLWDVGTTNHYYDWLVTDDGTTEYDIRCVLNDGELDGTRDEFKFEDNAVFVSIADDWDSDGIADSTDTLEGTGSNLNTTLNAVILIDGATNNSPSGSRTVTFEDSGTEFVRFTNDFDTNELVMPLITVDRSTTEKGSVLVKGLSGISKTFNIPKVLGTGLICVKNSSTISSVAEITAACNAADEILFDNCGIGGQTISGITCTDKNSYYEVSGLMNSAVTEFGTARLEVWSEGTYWQLDTISFFANYTNTTNHTITGADCNIWFDDTGWNDMTFDGTLHNYNRTFSSAGDRDYNVSCTHATYTNLTINNSFTISQSAIPEFSTITLGLGLVAVLAGLAIIRKKK